MKKYWIYTVALLSIIVFVQITACSKRWGPAEANYDAFEINAIPPVTSRALYRMDESPVVPANITDTGTFRFRISVGAGQEDDGDFIMVDPYESITWSILESPDRLPAGCTVSFNPTVCNESENESVMSVSVPATVVNGTYLVQIKMEHPTFNIPKTIRFSLTINHSITPPPPPPPPPPGATWNDVTPATGPLPTLTSVCFKDALNGFAVGMNGIFLITNDGGKNWRTGNLGTSENLYAIRFANSSRGYIAGTGIFLKTNDGGNTWQAPGPGMSNDLRGLFVVDTATAFVFNAAAGTSVFATSDAGNNWRTAGNFRYVSDILFTSPTNGFIIGNQGPYTEIHSTTDGGNTWATSPTHYDPGMIRMVNRGAGQLVACGYGSTMYNSTDGGNNWTSTNLASPGFNMYSLSFSGNHGIGVGFFDKVARTAGSGWNLENLGALHYLNEVVVLNDSAAIAVGYGYRNGGSAYEGVIMRRK